MWVSSKFKAQWSEIMKSVHTYFLPCIGSDKTKEFSFSYKFEVNCANKPSKVLPFQKFFLRIHASVVTLYRVRGTMLFSLAIALVWIGQLYFPKVNRRFRMLFSRLSSNCENGWTVCIYSIFAILKSFFWFLRSCLFQHAPCLTVWLKTKWLSWNKTPGRQFAMVYQLLTQVKHH